MDRARQQISLIDAASNLGLRPPEPGVAPGVYKLPWALRAQGLAQRLNAKEGGVVVAPRYQPDWHPGAGPRNLHGIATVARALAGVCARVMDSGDWPLVLGGDCSILLGPLLALRRRGRHGLVFIDGHTDFRHLGNAEAVTSVAGEDLAVATGRGDPAIADLDGLSPLVLPEDVAVLGVRSGDDNLAEVRRLGIQVVDADAVRLDATAAAQQALAGLRQREVEGFWIHLDVDVLDSAVMPAVDSPLPGGIGFSDLSALLRCLSADPLACGLQITIFDPDLDPDASHAAALVTNLVEGLSARRA